MIKYEDYLSNNFELSGSQEPTSFIRSQFDYGTRQRRAVRGYSTHDVKLTLEMYELQKFKQFWESLDFGTDIFLTDMVIHGDTTKGKQIRFKTSYSLSEWNQSGIYMLSAQVELIKTGTPIDESCPLIPQPYLYPEEGVIPC